MRDCTYDAAFHEDFTSAERIWKLVESLDAAASANVLMCTCAPAPFGDEGGYGVAHQSTCVFGIAQELMRKRAANGGGD